MASDVRARASEDIRRLGATSVPEALRLAPNLQIARQTALGYGDRLPEGGEAGTRHEIPRSVAAGLTLRF